MGGKWRLSIIAIVTFSTFLFFIPPVSHGLAAGSQNTNSGFLFCFVFFFFSEEKLWVDLQGTGRLARSRIQHRAKRKVGRVTRNPLRSPRRPLSALYVARGSTLGSMVPICQAAAARPARLPLQNFFILMELTPKAIHQTFGIHFPTHSKTP